MRNTKLSLLAASAMFAAASASSSTPSESLRDAFKAPRLPAGVRGKRCPQMVTSSDAEIAEWNRNCNTRQVRRAQERSK